MYNQILIIITGNSGSGKSTLADTISKLYNIKMLSVDKFREELFDKCGFKNEQERHILTELSKMQFKTDLIKIMRTKECVIVEHPFNESWQNFFDYVTGEYNYKSIIVNCNSRNFEDIWSGIVSRDLKSGTRHLGHSARTYIKDACYECNYALYNEEYKTEQGLKYFEGYYTRIKGTLTVIDSDFIDIFFKSNFVLLNFRETTDEELPLLTLLDRFNLFSLKQERGRICLYQDMLLNFIDLVTPIAYFVDDFAELNDNDLWKRLRNGNKDIVIDGTGNIKYFSSNNSKL